MTAWCCEESGPLANQTSLRFARFYYRAWLHRRHWSLRLVRLSTAPHHMAPETGTDMLASEKLAPDNCYLRLIGRLDESSRTSSSIELQNNL